MIRNNNYYREISPDYFRPVSEGYFRERLRGEESMQFDSGGLHLALHYIGPPEAEWFGLHTRHFFEGPAPQRVRICEITGQGRFPPLVNTMLASSIVYYLSGGPGNRVEFYQPTDPNQDPTVAAAMSAISLEDSYDITDQSSFIVNEAHIRTTIKTSPEPLLFIAYQWTSQPYELLLSGVLARENEYRTRIAAYNNSK